MAFKIFVDKGTAYQFVIIFSFTSIVSLRMLNDIGARESITGDALHPIWSLRLPGILPEYRTSNKF